MKSVLKGSLRIWNILNTVTFKLIMQCTSLYSFWKGNETKNPYLASNFTKNSNFVRKLQKGLLYFQNFQVYIFLLLTKKCHKLILFRFFGEKTLFWQFGTFWTKKVVPKSLDDFWQISEFLTKNCILQFSQKKWYF